MESITLMGTKIAVRPDQAAGVTAGGIVLVRTDALTMGEVVAAGPGRYLENGDFIGAVVKVGDRIAYTTGGVDINVNGEKLLVILEENVIGIIS